MKNKKYYIAYGSNLSVEQMAYRCPDAKIAGQAVLAGWELLFRGCATIAPNPKKNTPVLVWEISERDEGNLDLYEGYPNYYRKLFVSYNEKFPVWENAITRTSLEVLFLYSFLQKGGDANGYQREKTKADRHEGTGR